MRTEFEELSAIDFLLLMDNLDSFDLIRQEYYIIEHDRKSRENSDDELDYKGCRKLLRRFLCGMKVYPKADGIHSFDAFHGQEKYICVGGLEADNCDKFWELVYCREVNNIVKISQRREERSYQYWSSSDGSEVGCKGFRIKTLKVTKRPRFISTLLSLSNRENSERQIWHHEYTAWPTDINTEDPLMFLSFVCSLNDTYTLSKKKQSAECKPGVILVHGNNGTSSSAVYCILDICITQFKYTGTLSVANTLQNMRWQERSRLYYDADDYTFCYRAIHMYVLGEMGGSQKYLDERELTRIDTLL